VTLQTGSLRALRASTAALVEWDSEWVKIAGIRGGVPIETMQQDVHINFHLARQYKKSNYSR